MRHRAPERFDVEFRMSTGDAVVEVQREWAPPLADRFFNLVTHKFYDGNRCYRMLPGFVNQWGVNGDPAIGEVYNYLNDVDGAIVHPQPAEMDMFPGLSNTAGAMAFSTSYEVDSAGVGVSWNATAELFVNLVDNTRLDKAKFIVFAKVNDQSDLSLSPCSPR